MKHVVAVIIMVIALVSFNSFIVTDYALAKNCKTKEGSGINPAGKSGKPGFDNGKAWWKGDGDDEDRNRNRNRNRKHRRDQSNDASQVDQCADVRQQLDASISYVQQLEDENDRLYQQVLELQAQLEEQRIEQVQAASAPMEMTVVENLQAEARKFAIYRTSDTHPNTPGAYGVYTNFFIPEGATTHNLIDTLFSGDYKVTIKVATPDGDEVNIEADCPALWKQRDYYTTFIELDR